MTYKTDRPYKNTNQRGFTLVEIIVYVAILAVFLVALVQFASAVAITSSKARTRHEVQQNARFALERIVRDLRSADDINTGASTFGSHPAVLSIDHDDILRDPTVFDISSGRLRIAPGASGPYFLTSNDVTVTNFVVTDRSVAGKTKTLQIALTLEHTSAGSAEFDTSFSVQVSVVVREEE